MNEVRSVSCVYVQVCKRSLNSACRKLWIFKGSHGESGIEVRSLTALMH